MDRQILNFTANEQMLTVDCPIRISTNKVNYIEARFSLGQNWQGYDSVRAVWFTDYKCISTVLDSQGVCSVPFEVMKRKGNVKVNLVGSISVDDVLTDRLTSYPVIAVVVDCVAPITGAETSPITPSQFEQYVAIVQALVGSVRDIDRIELNPDYTLTIYYSDGTSDTTSSIRGATGNGIASIAKTGSSGTNPVVDTYTVTYTGGNTFAFTVTNGKKGDTGATGATGNGIQSIYKTGTSGLVDTYTILYTNGNTTTFEVTNGQNGSLASTVLASTYSSSKTYAVGDYVYYSGNLYRCTTAITTAEAWTSGHWTQVALADDVSDLKSALNDIIEANKEDVTLSFVAQTGYIDTTGTLIAYSNIWKAIVPIESGYTYVLKYRSYYGMCEVVYYDSSDVFISGTASHNTDAMFTEELQIPSGASYMAIQAYGLISTIYTNYSLSRYDNYELKQSDSIELSADILSQISEDTLEKVSLSFESATGYIDISGNLNPYSNMWKDEITVKAGEKYYLDYRAYFGMCEMLFYNADDVFLSGVLNHNSDDYYYQNVEITVPSGATKAIVQEYATSAQLANETYVLRKYSGNYIVKSKLSGKLIAYNGDSIAESRLRGYGVNGGSYPHIISEITNSSYNNRAVGGGILASAAPAGTNPPHFIVSDITNMPDNADIVCLEGGLNDFYDNVPLGTFDDNDYTGTLDTTTVCGALESIFRQSIIKWVGKPICFIFIHRCYGTKAPNTAGYTYQEMRDKMIGICHKYSIPFYDAYTESGLNAYNDIQNTNFLTANGTGTPDGTHPNEAGYRAYYVPQVISLFESII